jgi:hypothetical protein
LQLPILNERGDIRHQRGITPDPGVVVLGMRFQATKGSNLIDGVGRFQATKGSNLIDGVGADAEELADYLAAREEARSAA